MSSPFLLFFLKIYKLFLCKFFSSYYMTFCACVARYPARVARVWTCARVSACLVLLRAFVMRFARVWTCYGIRVALRACAPLLRALRVPCLHVRTCPDVPLSACPRVCLSMRACVRACGSALLNVCTRALLRACPRARLRACPRARARAHPRGIPGARRPSTNPLAHPQKQKKPVYRHLQKYL